MDEATNRFVIQMTRQVADAASDSLSKTFTVQNPTGDNGATPNTRITVTQVEAFITAYNAVYGVTGTQAWVLKKAYYSTTTQIPIYPVA